MRALALSFVLMTLCAAMACRDQVSFQRYNYNMGTPDRPLMPTGLPNLDPTILNGKATLVSLGEPDEPVAESTAVDDRAAIAELVERFRAAIKSADYQAVVPLMVKRQREVARATAPNNVEIHHVVEELIAALKQGSPQMYAQMGTMLEAMMDVQLDLDKLQFQSQSEASVPLPIGNGTPLGFEKSDGQWFIVDPQLADSAQAEIQKITAAKTMFSNLTAILKNSSLTPQERAARLMKAMAEAAAAAQAGDADTSNDSSDSDNGI